MGSGGCYNYHMNLQSSSLESLSRNGFSFPPLVFVFGQVVVRGKNLVVVVVVRSVAKCRTFS